jgi:AcrR family transcriptional regulator
MAKQDFMNTREEILRLSVPLFATKGFDGVSMRNIAAVVDLTPAAIYHHFSDKEQLYLNAVRYAFIEKVGHLTSLLDGGGRPWDRLETFVVIYTRTLSKEKDFRSLMQWVLLDSDERRLQSLVDCVFRNLFTALRNLAAELAPSHDAHLLAISLIGLVTYPFETHSVRRFLQGYQHQHEDPEVIARHLIDLLRNGLGGSTRNNHSILPRADVP